MSTLNVNNINEAGGVDAVITAGVLDSGSLPAGSILQVVSTTKTDTFSTSSTSFTDITGMTVSITPSSASNKILVFSNVLMGISSDATPLINLVRDATAIAQTGFATNDATLANRVRDNNDIDSTALSFLDSPATTSAVTYKLQVKTVGPTFYLNRNGINVTYGGVSTITVMEVAG